MHKERVKFVQMMLSRAAVCVHGHGGGLWVLHSPAGTLLSRPFPGVQVLPAKGSARSWLLAAGRIHPYKEQKSRIIQQELVFLLHWQSNWWDSKE